MRPALLPALLATSAVLAGIVALELVTGERSAPAARPAAAAMQPVAARLADPAPSPVAALLARPPFSPSRRPEAVPGGDDPRLPHLTGILVTREERRAIFAGRDGGRGTVVVQGDQVGAYRVQDISASDVTLAGADGAHVIRPTFSTAAPPAPPASAGLQLPQLMPPPTAMLGNSAGLPQNPGAPGPPVAGNRP